MAEKYSVLFANKHENLSTTSITEGRIFASVTSSLSIVGALLIIISYVVFKDIRTNARNVLFHLSIGDLGVALTNLIGALVYYGGLTSHCTSAGHPSCQDYLNLCKAQAFFAMFFTIASTLWTMVLALYVYVLVIDTGRALSQWLVRVSYVLCWGLPVAVTLWLVLTNRLGISHLGSSGWCTLKVDTSSEKTMFTVFFGNDVWVMTTFVVILVLYTTSHCYLRIRVKEINSMYNSLSVPANAIMSDRKFLLIPVAFLFLKIGTILFSVLHVYTSLWTKLSHTIHLIIYYWMGIGDSGEGCINGIIFCFLTPRVADKICICCRKASCRTPQRSQLEETAEQKKLLGNLNISYNSSYHSTAVNYGSDSDSSSDE